jgi:uncharacterized phage protein (TIGR01671 family)
MREIKFRAWDSQQKCFVELQKIDFENDRVWINPAVESHNAICDLVYEQFTCLHDKNGVEIYEGDILKCETGNNEIVEHKYGAFMCRYRRIVLYQLWIKQQLEIIGNIHENPELLEEQKK